MNNRIIIDSEIQHGKPVIKGTRVPITRILGGLAGGMSYDDIIFEYEITKEDILAVMKFANELVTQETFYPLLVKGYGHAVSG